MDFQGRKEGIPGLRVSNYVPRELSNDFREFIPKAANSLAAHAVLALIQISVLMGLLLLLTGLCKRRMRASGWSLSRIFSLLSNNSII